MINVLLTGDMGFIGGHLRAELEAAERPRGAGRQYGIQGWDRHRMASQDLAREPLVPTLNPDVVIHAAAKVSRLLGEEGKAHTIADNATATMRVATFCAERHIPLVYLSTSEAYGDVELGNDYGAPAGDELPGNLYGLSKRWGEEVCRLYMPAESLVILRLSMPYGTGHLPGRGRAALTNFIWNAMRGEPITVHAGAERSWCWVGDTVRGIRMVLEHAIYSDDPYVRRLPVWNVGRDDNARSMLEVAELVRAELRSSSPIEVVEPPPGQIVVKRLNTRRLASIGWTPTVELEEGVQRVHEWLQTIALPRPAASRGIR